MVYQNRYSLHWCRAHRHCVSRSDGTIDYLWWPATWFFPRWGKVDVQVRLHRKRKPNGTIDWDELLSTTERIPIPSEFISALLVLEQGPVLSEPKSHLNNHVAAFPILDIRCCVDNKPIDLMRFEPTLNGETTGKVDIGVFRNSIAFGLPVEFKTWSPDAVSPFR